MLISPLSGSSNLAIEGSNPSLVAQFPSGLGTVPIPPPGPCRNDPVLAKLISAFMSVRLEYRLRKPRKNSPAEKGGFKIEENIKALCASHPWENTLFLTLNFPPHTTPRRAKESVNRFIQKVLASLFSAYYWVLVIERTSRGRRVHAHMVVISHEDTRSGVNPSVLARYNGIRRQAKASGQVMTRKEIAERRSLIPHLTTNKALKSIWAKLSRTLPRLGFWSEFPAEILPIEKNIDAIACYIAKNFRESYSNKVAEESHLRLWGCSQNAPKVIGAVNRLSLLTPGAAQWRANVKLAAMAVGIEDLEKMDKEYGKKWHWGMRRVVRWIDEVSRIEGKTPEPNAIKDKVLEVLGRPRSWYSPEESMTDAELTTADIRRERVAMAPARAAVLAGLEDLAKAS